MAAREAPQVHADQPGDEIRGDDGFVVDEYSDENFDDADAVDALDVPGARVDVSVLDQIAISSGDGMEAVDIHPRGARVDTVDSGAKDIRNDEADMDLGVEAPSPEDLERAAIGRGSRGRRNPL